MEHGASRLVYTSTYNVVFGGQEIRNGDESTISYLPLDKVQGTVYTACTLIMLRSKKLLLNPVTQYLLAPIILEGCMVRVATVCGQVRESENVGTEGHEKIVCITYFPIYL